jgi:hypothetical protein
MMRWVGIIISFPRKQVGDFTLAKLKEAETNPRMFGDRGATWEINPQYDPAHPLFKPDMEWVVLDELNLRIPAPFKDEFLRDPTDAKTKYMCDPPPQEGGFFEIPHKLEEAVNRDLPPIVVTKNTVEREVGGGGLMKYVALELDQLPPRADDCSYFMHGDPGLVNDFFALCVCHTLPESKWIVDAEGVEREIRRVVVDFILTWEPRANTPVDLMNVDETILRLARYYGIRHVTFDRWNSAGSIQRLTNAGIMAEDLSFSSAQQFQMYRNLKMLVYNSLLTIPDDRELLNELIYLKVKNGKMDHDAFGKDRADAIAAAAWWGDEWGVARVSGSGKDQIEVGYSLAWEEDTRQTLSDPCRDGAKGLRFGKQEARDRFPPIASLVRAPLLATPY